MCLGTCEWFVKTDRFSDWILEGNNPFIFLTAGPGCGKSVLAKYLVEDQFVRMNLVHCYFFFGALGPQSDTLLTALKAFLYQLHTNHAGSLSVGEHLEVMKIIHTSWEVQGPILTQNLELMLSTLTKIV